MMENVSQLNKEVLLALNRAVRKKGPFWTFLGVEEILFLALAFLSFRIDPNDDLWIVLLAIAILLGPAVLLAVHLSVRRLFRSDRILQNEATVDFSFREEDFTTHAKTASTESSATVRYSTLFRAYDSENHVFLMINQQNAYCVDKKGFTSGSAEELLEVLRKNGVKIR